jgi:O-antigen ligase
LWNATLSEAAPAAAPLGRRAERALVGIVLVLALTLSPALGRPTTYALLGLAALTIPVLLVAGDVRWAPPPLAGILVAAFAILALLFVVTANDVWDAFAVLNFAGLVLYWPLAILLGRAANPGNAQRSATLALAGTCIAAVYAGITVLLSPIGRGGDVIANDPIRLANSTVILGFMSVVLMAPSAQGVMRWVYRLAGPLVALAVVILAGARIAMIAYPVIAFVTIMLTIRRKWLGLLLGLGLIGVLALVVMSGAFGNERMALLVQAITGVLTGKETDQAVAIRLMMWRAGWTVFESAPLLGVGWANMMEAVTALTPTGAFPENYFTHLHNEALTFAVAGGLIGVAVFIALIAAPLVVALRSVRDSQYKARVDGVVVVIAAYVVMGLTDTMVGFELHTALYVGFMAILLGYCRDARPAAR